MERTEFEALRDAPGKVIDGDVRLVQSSRVAPLFVAEEVQITSEGDAELVLNTNYTPDTGRFIVNVFVRGVGPICRLCVNGVVHGDAGRSHKHSVHTARCTGRNLPNAQPRQELEGQTLASVWAEFCRMAKIEHRGSLVCDGCDPVSEVL